MSAKLCNEHLVFQSAVMASINTTVHDINMQCMSLYSWSVPTLERIEEIVFCMLHEIFHPVAGVQSQSFKALAHSHINIPREATT